MKVKITLLEEVLGSSPSNEDLLATYIASKAPTSDLTAEEVDNIKAQNAEERITVFPKTADGTPFLYDYQVKGMFKDSCKMLAKAGKAGYAGGKACAAIKAYKQAIDGLIFVTPREIPYDLHGMKVDFCERPLRAQTPMGERVGTTMTKSKNIFIMIALSFLLGVMITISEPDLQVLAGQVPSIPNMVLILTVAVGVGFFLVLALVRMLFGIQLSHMLLVFYAVVFTLAYFVPGDFLAVAFDSGGVTTGPMTVPFIMALGVGISAIRSDKRAADDSFGLVALCSIGPILAVLVLSMIYRPDVNAMSTGSEPIQIMDDTVQMWRAFMEEFPAYMKEIAISLLPIIVFFFFPSAIFPFRFHVHLQRDIYL